jgi:hypothetical protein
MRGPKAYQKRQAKARQRRYLKTQERLERDRRQAQQAATVLEQALHDLGLPTGLVAEVEGRAFLTQYEAFWVQVDTLVAGVCRVLSFTPIILCCY